MNSSNLALKNKLNSLAEIKLHLVHAKLTEQVSLANKGFLFPAPNRKRRLQVFKSKASSQPCRPETDL